MYKCLLFFTIVVLDDDDLVLRHATCFFCLVSVWEWCEIICCTYRISKGDYVKNLERYDSQADDAELANVARRGSDRLDLSNTKFVFYN